MKLIFIIISFVFLSNLNAQNKFKVEQKETETWRSLYSINDEKDNLIKQLDSSKYLVSFNDNNLRYFAIFLIKGRRGWSAIDSNEKILFEVYNQGNEINPDYLVENKIRIVDESQKIEGMAKVTDDANFTRHLKKISLQKTHFNNDLTEVKNRE